MFGRITEKWLSTLILKSKCKRLFFLVKQKRHHILHWTLIIALLNKYHFKNSWAFIWTVSMFKKVNKTISLLRKLQNNLPRAPLVTIYKSFIRSHLDYGDILCDQTFNNSFRERLKSIQYNGTLAITGAIRGNSREKLSRTRLWVPIVTTMVQETLSIFQNNKKSISQVPLCIYTNCQTSVYDKT